MPSFSQAFTLLASQGALNPADASPGWLFSNTNHTVQTAATVNTTQSVRANRLIDATVTNQVYFEVTIDRGAESLVVGIANDQYDLGEFGGIGTEGLIARVFLGWTSAGYLPQSAFSPGQVMANNQRNSGSQVLSWGHANNANGAVVGVCLDVAAGRLWVRSDAMLADGNTWNNSPNATPDSRTGGVDLTFIAPGPYFAAVSCRDPNAQVTINLVGPFKYPIPVNARSYDSQSQPYATPSFSAPTNLLVPTAPTASAVPLSWTAPSSGTAPFTYDVQYINGVTNGNPAVAWSNVASGLSATAMTLAVAASSGGNLHFARVRAHDARGAVSAWSTPLLIETVTTTGAQPLFPPFFTSGATGNLANFAKIPFPDPPDITQADFVGGWAWAPLIPQNVFIDYELSGQIVSFDQWNGVFVALPSEATETIVPAFLTNPVPPPLVAGQEYQLARQRLSNGNFEPTQFTIDIFSLDKLDRRIHPAGTEFITWGGQNYQVFVPVTASPRFAFYYDHDVWNSTDGPTIVNNLLPHAETAYDTCVAWFGDQSNHAPGIRTSINRDSSLINIFLTAHSGFGGAHLTCRNSDIMLGAESASRTDFSQPTPGIRRAVLPNDLMNVDHYSLVLMAELTEVFMPNLAALPDCDQHAFGEALSLAMAADLFPAGWASSQTVARLPAQWMNGFFAPDGTSDFPPPTGLGVNRGDWINTNKAGETFTEFAAIGCNTVFLMYLRHQLGFTFPQICSVLATLPANATARQVYNALAGNAIDPFPAFVGLLNTSYPPPATASDTGRFVDDTFINPFPLPQAPIAPTNVAYVSSTNTSLTLSFEYHAGPGGVTFTPTLFFGNNQTMVYGGPEQPVRSFQRSTFNFTMSNLTPNTDYAVLFTASNGLGSATSAFTQHFFWVGTPGGTLPSGSPPTLLGPPSGPGQLNLIITGDGFATADQTAFNNACDLAVAAIQNEAAYARYIALNRLSVTRLNAISNVSGIPTANPNNMYGTVQDPATTLRFHDERISQTIYSRFPDYSVGILLTNFNSPQGVTAIGVLPQLQSIAVIMTIDPNNRFQPILLHELGHAIGQVLDEYGGTAGRYTGAEPSAANITANTDRATIKWGSRILPSTPLPTVSNPNCAQPVLADPSQPDVVGLFETAGTWNCGLYQAQSYCYMNGDGAPYCVICDEEIDRNIRTVCNLPAAVTPSPSAVQMTATGPGSLSFAWNTQAGFTYDQFRTWLAFYKTFWSQSFTGLPSQIAPNRWQTTFGGLSSGRYMFAVAAHSLEGGWSRVAYASNKGFAI